MMLLNNDHGHPLPDAPVFYSVLSKNKQELRAAARANRMMKRFHLTIPYIITLPWKNGIMIRTMFTSCSVLIQNQNRESSSMRIKVQAAA